MSAQDPSQAKVPKWIDELPPIVRRKDLQSQLSAAVLSKAVASGELEAPRLIGGVWVFSKEAIIEYWLTRPTSRAVTPERAKHLRQVAEAGRRAYAEGKADRWRAKAARLEREAAHIRAAADALDPLNNKKESRKTDAA